MIIHLHKQQMINCFWSEIKDNVYAAFSLHKK